MRVDWAVRTLVKTCPVCGDHSRVNLKCCDEFEARPEWREAGRGGTAVGIDTEDFVMISTWLGEWVLGDVARPAG